MDGYVILRGYEGVYDVCKVVEKGVDYDRQSNL